MKLEEIPVLSGPDDLQRHLTDMLTAPDLDGASFSGYSNHYASVWNAFHNLSDEEKRTLHSTITDVMRQYADAPEKNRTIVCHIYKLYYRNA